MTLDTAEIIVSADGTIRCEQDGLIVEEVNALASPLLLLEPRRLNVVRFLFDAVLVFIVGCAAAVAAAWIGGI